MTQAGKGSGGNAKEGHEATRPEELKHEGEALPTRGPADRTDNPPHSLASALETQQPAARRGGRTDGRTGVHSKMAGVSSKHQRQIRAGSALLAP